MRATKELPTHHSERGASAVEYGLMIAAIAAVIAVGAFGFGDLISDIFTQASRCIESSALAQNPSC